MKAVRCMANERSNCNSRKRESPMRYSLRDLLLIGLERLLGTHSLGSWKSSCQSNALTHRPDEQGKITIVGSGDERVGFTAIADAARFIAHALTCRYTHPPSLPSVLTYTDFILQRHLLPRSPTPCTESKGPPRHSTTWRRFINQSLRPRSKLCTRRLSKRYNGSGKRVHRSLSHS